MSVTVVEDFIPISDRNLNIYLKRLSYIPKHWNAEIICNKTIEMLTQEELVIASYILNEKILINLINEYKKEPTFQKHQVLSDRLNSYNYQLCVNIKLTEEERFEIQQTANDLSVQELKTSRSILSEKEELSFIEEYELHVIENKLIYILKNSMEHDIKSKRKVIPKRCNKLKNKERY